MPTPLYNSTLLDFVWIQSFILSTVASLLCVCSSATPLVKQTHGAAALYIHPWHRDREQSRWKRRTQQCSWSLRYDSCPHTSVLSLHTHCSKIEGQKQTWVWEGLFLHLMSLVIIHLSVFWQVTKPGDIHQLSVFQFWWTGHFGKWHPYKNQPWSSLSTVGKNFVQQLILWQYFSV